MRLHSSTKKAPPSLRDRWSQIGDTDYDKCSRLSGAPGAQPAKARA